MHNTDYPRRNYRNARIVLAALAAMPVAGLVNSARAANSTWLDVAGTFSTPGNWSAGVPGADTGTTSTDIATFQRSSITASRVVTFDAARNLGGITFENSSSTAGRVFTLSAATLGQATPTLTFSPNAVIQNTGSGTATTGTNTMDIAMLLTGNTTISNTYGNSVFNVGMTSGASANSITTATNLGDIDLTLGGTSTGSNLFSMRINQAAGTSVRIVKEGTGFWQVNGPTATAGTMSRGLLLRQGGLGIGRSSALPFGSGPLVIGDSSTVAGELRVNLGSGINSNSAITVANSAATSVAFERGGGSGAGTYSGTIGINRDVIFRHSGTANQALNVTGAISGTGDVYVTTTAASPAPVNFTTGGLNHSGKFINNSTSASGLVTVSSLIGSTVTEVVQNSSTSAMAISNSTNAFDKTTLSAGTLSVTGSGRLGTGDITISNGATLTLSNNSSIQNTSAMFFGSTSLINLNFTGVDTLSMLASLGGTYISPGTYNITQLNAFFGGASFAGTGSLEVLSAIPEPSSFAALAGLGILGYAATRRRARR